MAGNVSRLAGLGPSAQPAAREPAWMRRTLIGVAVVFIACILLVPLALVFAKAFSNGFVAYWRAITERDTLSAVRLTLLAAAIAVPLNLVFGVAAAWAITKYEFRGKRVLITLIDIPFAVSPVISGMVFVLLFGASSALGPWLTDHGIRIVFAVPGIVLATMFVTFPFVARELIPVMQGQGVNQELAALSLGASGWQTFFLVTLPNIRWALLYGTILCAARAVGEFGAVSVVSGHIRGKTNTTSLHVEILYNEYAFADAFAVATLLVIVAVITLVAKSAVEWRVHRTATAAMAPTAALPKEAKP